MVALIVIVFAINMLCSEPTRVILVLKFLPPLGIYFLVDWCLVGIHIFLLLV